MNGVDSDPLARIAALEHDLHKLRGLVEVGKRLSTEPSLDKLLVLVTDTIRDVMEADRCTLYLVDRQRNQLWSRIAQDAEVPEIRVPIGQGVAGWVAETGELLNLQDAYENPHFDREFDKRTGYRTRTILSVPMRSHEEDMIGVVQVINKRVGTFTQNDVDLLQVLASMAAGPLEIAQFIESRRKTFEGVLEALATATDTRDYITAGHSRRVTEYSVRLARQLGLSDERVTMIRYASLVHDIGKFAVPESVLFKPGRLNDEEYAVIKQHAVWTKKILSNVPWSRGLEEIPSVAADHHERVDGKGYPEGLHGDEIPLGARIIAVADVYDALTSERQYKPGMPAEQVIAILRKDSGTAFDLRVVEAFVDCLSLEPEQDG